VPTSNVVSLSHLIIPKPDFILLEEKKRKPLSISPPIFSLFNKKKWKTLLVTVSPRSCPLCYRCRKKGFYLDCSGAVLGPWYTTTAVSLAVGACSALSASRLLLPLPPVRLRLDPVRCPVPITRIVSVVLLLPVRLKPCESPQLSFWYLIARFLCRIVQYNQEISLFIIQPSCVRINDLQYLCCRSAV
jgi:hypothetical protein